MTKKFVGDVDVSGKLVFVRNDFNVPFDATGAISDDTRIREALPTFRHLMERGARIVCASHLGRPKGEVIPECSLRPVALRLGELLGRPVLFPGVTVGPEAEKAIAALKGGEVLLLENLRFLPGETKNDDAFAQKLAAGIEVYVNDAFGACHRAHSSIDAITRHVPLAVAGFLLKKEIDYLSMATIDPPARTVVVLGGAKVTDKIPVISHLMEQASAVLIGGAMAYTFLRAQGVDVGSSRVDETQLDTCRELLAKAERLHVDFRLPVDHIAAVKIEPGITVKMVNEGDPIPTGMLGLDIGFTTTRKYSEIIAGAELVIWNGPMGVFEIDTFAGGTMAIAKAIAGSHATSIVGGGDSVAAVHAAGVESRISHISTGGGASLEFLAGDTLPGIAALTEC